MLRHLARKDLGQGKTNAANKPVTKMGQNEQRHKRLLLSNKSDIDVQPLIKKRRHNLHTYDSTHSSLRDVGNDDEENKDDDDTSDTDDDDDNDYESYESDDDVSDIDSSDCLVPSKKFKNTDLVESDGESPSDTSEEGSHVIPSTVENLTAYNKSSKTDKVLGVEFTTNDKKLNQEFGSNFSDTSGKLNNACDGDSRREHSDSSNDDDDSSGSDDYDEDDDDIDQKILNAPKLSNKMKQVNSLKEQVNAAKDNRAFGDIDSNDDSEDNDEDKSDDDDLNESDDETKETQDELEAVKKELANIPLEDLMKIKEKVGLKVFNKLMHGGKFDEKKKKVFKRENKNRPMEISSKRKVPVLRQTDVPKEKVRRDPRFDDLSGEFLDQHFTRNYSFLSDIKAKEKLLIQKKLKKTKNEDKKQELARLLNRMNQQEQAEEMKHKKMELEKQWKEKERQLVKEGKTPYFLKKSDKKKLELAEKYKELNKTGQMDKYMSRRMKKNAQKEKKKLPGRHQRF